MDGMYVDGKRVSLSVPVATWDEHGMRFSVSRDRKIHRAVMLHWTAGENPAERVFANLRAHKSAETGKPEPLSVHFVVEPAGAIYQLADTHARCSHAGKPYNANDWSLGIEFVCRGDAYGVALKPGIERPRCTDVIHGERCTYDSLTSAQLASGIVLIEALLREYQLPQAVPMRRGDVVADELNALEVAKFRGALGHMHIKRGKRDPGARLLRVLAARWGLLKPQGVA